MNKAKNPNFKSENLSPDFMSNHTLATRPKTAIQVDKFHPNYSFTPQKNSTKNCIDEIFFKAMEHLDMDHEAKIPENALGLTQPVIEQQRPDRYF